MKGSSLPIQCLGVVLFNTVGANACHISKSGHIELSGTSLGKAGYVAPELGWFTPMVLLYIAVYSPCDME